MRHALALLLFACADEKGDDPDRLPVDSADTAALDARPANPTCLAFDRLPPTSAVTVEEAYAGVRLAETVAMRMAPQDADHWYVIEKSGRILRFSADPAASGSETALDITDRVGITFNEMGLLGFSFHPDFPDRPELFVNYTSIEGGRHSVIARFTSLDGGTTFDPDTEEILLTVDQPYENHNGGPVEFGPDGLLYLGFGDGGSAGDPLGSGQDTFSLLGKVLRIDVDGGTPYAIPADNPYADGVDGAPEIYALGMRNPWKMSFDTATGELWAGDVGQDRYEEVDRIERGGNYGWNTMEASHCYPASADCDPAGLILPIVEYPHSDGVSITGGYVYHGSAIPSLDGTYLFGDYATRAIWGITYDAVTGAPAATLLVEDAGTRIASFAQDADGEVYVVGFNGAIKKLVPAAADPSTDFPLTLSATGCVDPADPTTLAPGLLPYTITAPLWSDGAEKARYLALPDGSALHMAEDGDIEAPIGSVLVKEFRRGGQLLETRLLVRHEDGDWAGYSYAWRPDGSDADFVRGGRTATLDDGSTWTWPRSADCLTCHTEAAGRSLGLERDQLEVTITTPAGHRENQLDHWATIGLLDAPAVHSTRPLVDYTDEAVPDAEAARAYLHANCAHCHRADDGFSTMDLRWTTAEADMGLLSALPQHGDLGVEGALLVTPGDPSHSLVALRMAATDASAMPPLARAVVDEVGLARVEAWISALTTTAPLR